MLQTLSSFFRPVFAERNPHQLALAIALGAALGLVPKLNLIAVVWLLLLFMLRVNLLVGLISAGAASMASVALDPYLHRLGDFLLSSELLSPLFVSVYRLPLGAWTSINNTVVVGATVIGLLQIIPTYRASQLFFRNRFEQPDKPWLLKKTRAEASTGWRI